MGIKSSHIGVVDGFRSKGVEVETDIEDRKQF
jgi:adenosine/AMP kinase